jgi:hypothetical protein
MVSVRRGKSRNKITNEKWKVQRVSDELSLLTKIIYGQPKIELVQAIVGSEVIKETLGQTLHEQKLKERKKKLKSEAPVILTDFGL